MKDNYNAPGHGIPREARDLDTTSLSEKGHGKLVHRDYAAHYFRWGFATRFCTGKKVLDVGCGPEYPLGKVLLSGIGHLPEIYVGVDFNKLPNCEGLKLKLHEKVDFITGYQDIHTLYGDFDIITCFEVLEHTTNPLGMLQGIYNCLAPNGQVMISTPVNEGRKAARNHIKEYSIQELKDLIDQASFVVDKRYGTFMDVKKLNQVATKEQKDIIEQLSAYYSNDVLSTFLAPLYPDQSKNNLWILKKKAIVPPPKEESYSEWDQIINSGCLEEHMDKEI